MKTQFFVALLAATHVGIGCDGSGLEPSSAKDSGHILADAALSDGHAFEPGDGWVSLDAGGAVGASDAAGPIVRWVERRSPFGNLREPQNLVLDGDFEFTGSRGQMPWLIFSAVAQESLTFETGGKCPSGVRCAKVGKGQTLIGFAVLPPTGTVRLTAKVRPSSGSCAGIDVGLADLSDTIKPTEIAPLADSPVESEWCWFTGQIRAYPNGAPYVYVHTTTKETAVVDDVVLVPLPEPTSVTPPPRRIDSALQERLSAIGKRVRALRMNGNATLPKGPTR